MHIAACQILNGVTIPGILKLREVLHRKSVEYMGVVKISRTHFMDATPLSRWARSSQATCPS